MREVVRLDDDFALGFIKADLGACEADSQRQGQEQYLLGDIKEKYPHRQGESPFVWVECDERKYCIGLEELVKRAVCDRSPLINSEVAKAYAVVVRSLAYCGNCEPFKELITSPSGVYYKSLVRLTDDVLGKVIRELPRDALEIFCFKKASELALQGANYIAILKVFFPHNTALEVNPCGIGDTLAFGARGEQVRTLQNNLNRVSLFNPTIPKLRPDGIYGGNTELAVKKFQHLYMLESDGIAGRRTLTRLFYAHHKVGLLLGLKIPKSNFERIPTPGARGDDVERLQNMLMALSLFYTELDGFYYSVRDELGFYGQATAGCVGVVQAMLGSTASGVCSQADMIKLNAVCCRIKEHIPQIKRRVPYLGAPLTLGCVGDEVLTVGHRLLEICYMHPEIPTFFLCDVFTGQMERAVLQLQQLFLDRADGIIDRETWELIMQKSEDISAARYCLTGQCPITD